VTCKAIIFDYIGTLVNCRGYNMADSENTLYNSLSQAGFDIEKKQFLYAYEVAHKKYRIVRYQQFREVTNAIWVAEALTNLGYPVSPEDRRVKTALNVFFRDFIDTLELREGAKKLLNETTQQHRVGLLSNFTYGPVIHKSLQKIGINQVFNAIIVSEEVGWRKPSPVIFQDILQRLNVASCDAVYVGDSPLEDIKGAKDMGIRTVFVPSQFNSFKDLEESKQEPDYTVEDLSVLSKKLKEIVDT
jgi:putative hydrolase of the HAD superfamily